MKSFPFEIVTDHETATEEIANAIYEAGGDDALVSSSNGSMVVAFDRVDANLESAIQSAMETLRIAGINSATVTIDASYFRQVSNQ